MSDQKGNMGQAGFSMLAGILGGPLGAIGYTVGRDMFDSPIIGFLVGSVANMVLKSQVAEEDIAKGKKPAQSPEEIRAEKDRFIIMSFPEVMKNERGRGAIHAYMEKHDHDSMEEAFDAMLNDPAYHNYLKDIMSKRG